MKKTILSRTLAVAALVGLTVTNANATSWRINNDVTKKAHFTDINAAMNSADVVDGDTLYLDPGCTISKANITKRITLIGTGYTSNAHNTAFVTGDFTIRAANTKMEGVYFSCDVQLLANYITVERCKIDGTVRHAWATAQYATIRQCQINGRVCGYGKTGQNTLGWTIENCIIRGNFGYDSAIDGLYNPIIRNNFIQNTTTTNDHNPAVLASISGGNIYNNILLNVLGRAAKTLRSDVENCNVRHNVFSDNLEEYASTYPENTCLNLGYEDAQKILFTLTGNDMDIYRLADESPAKGAGNMGEDCGPFAGNYPYIVYGHPYGIPYFEESQVDSRAVNGKLNVKQRVVMQNQ